MKIQELSISGVFVLEPEFLMKGTEEDQRSTMEKCREIYQSIHLKGL